MLLGTPLRIRDTVLRNRIVSAPMERNYCALDGTPTQRYAAYLAARAAGGAALVFTEAAYVRADGRGRACEGSACTATTSSQGCACSPTRCTRREP